MKRRIRKRFIAMCLALPLLFGCAACSGMQANENQASQEMSTSVPESIYPPITGISTDDTLGSQHLQITQELISMLDHSPGLKAMMEKSIEKAKEINPDKATNPVQTLEAYYTYIDWAALALPWAITPNLNESKLYEQIDQSLNYFYFLCDQPLEELEGQGLYNNSLQYEEPFRTWLINFTAQYGQVLNTTDSWSEEYYQIALSDERFNLDTDTYEDPSNWHTFNEFFVRYLSSPDQRPIASPDDDSVVVSPSDAEPQGVWDIDENSNLVCKDGVNIKSGVFTSVEALLGDSAYKDAFAGGTLTHTFLDVNDYHRYHFPVSGTIKEVLTISGDDAVGGSIVWNEELGKYLLKATNPDWQSIETRGLIIIETEQYGLVAVMPVGMSQISSVCFEDTVQVGASVTKGDMMGCFLFGGSDIVMLFQKDVDLICQAPQQADGSYEHINMGEVYGTLSLKNN